MMVTILYAICAFWNLGNTRSPQTFTPMEGARSDSPNYRRRMPYRLVLFPGVGQGNYSVEYSELMRKAGTLSVPLPRIMWLC